MTKHLYTPKDVKKERERLYKEQEGVDPILKEVIDLKDTCLDHDHITQKVRCVLHRQTNAFEGRVVNAYKRNLAWLTDLPLPVILRNLAEYLERDFSDAAIHPSWTKVVMTKFNSLSEGQKKTALQSLASPVGENSKQRKELFRKILLSRKFTLTQIEHVINSAKE